MIGGQQKRNSAIMANEISTANITTRNNKDQIENCFTFYVQSTDTALIKIVGTDKYGTEQHHTISGIDIGEQWKQINIDLTGTNFKKVRTNWL